MLRIEFVRFADMNFLGKVRCWFGLLFYWYWYSCFTVFFNNHFLSTYKVLDWFFMVLHPALILFNVFGWIFPTTRKANLILLIATGLSWVVLGIWMGFGYCPLTDWHFDILEKLGHRNLPHSYIAYLMNRLSGWRFSDPTTDNITLSVYVIALLCSILANRRQWIKNKHSK